MSLGSRINEIRKERGMSIDDLCALSGVPKGTLSKITAGITTSPTLDTVKAIAKALNCHLDDLDDESARETKKTPSTDEAVLGDKKRSEIMGLVGDLDDSQQDFLIAILEQVSAKNQEKRPVAPASAPESAPGSGLPDQT